MKKFGYRFALITGVTSLLVSASIAPVSLAKPSGKNLQPQTKQIKQNPQTKPRSQQKIAVLPVVGGVVLGADTVIKIVGIYIGICGLKTPSDCGKNATKAFNEINAYLKQTGSKVTMTLKQAYDMALKYKNEIVAPPKPKTPGQNNIVPLNLPDKVVQPRKTRTGEDDDNTDCNGINSILQKLKHGALPEVFQKTREFPEYNIIVCISKKILNKEQLTEKIKKYIEKSKTDQQVRQTIAGLGLPRNILPLKTTATIYVSNFQDQNSLIGAMDVFKKMDNFINGSLNNKNQAGNLKWNDLRQDFNRENTILLLRNFVYSDVAYDIVGVAIGQNPL